MKIRISLAYDYSSECEPSKKIVPANQKGITAAATAVRKELTIPELGFSNQFCAITTLRLWRRLGRPENLLPTNVRFGDGKYQRHVILFDKEKGDGYDPTADQYDLKWGYVKDARKVYDVKHALPETDLAQIEQKRNPLIRKTFLAGLIKKYGKGKK